MPIRPYLQSNAFDPETVQAMGIAFEKCRQKLGLAPKRDAATEMVAKAIIALAEAGERDPERLYLGALMRFNSTT
jgi:predicted transcriptional regulator